jgi:hypothetical protein
MLGYGSEDASEYGIEFRAMSPFLYFASESEEIAEPVITFCSFFVPSLV